MFFCKFSEISRNNFFIEHIRATAFGLSFVNPRKKSEPTSLVKFLRSCHFNIKWREDQLKKKTRSKHRMCSIKKGVLKRFTKFKHLQQSLFLNKVAGRRHMFFPVNLWNFKNTFFAEHFRTNASKRCSLRKAMNNSDC